MFPKNKPFFICLFIIGLAFACTLSAALSVPKPIGSDYFWHLNIASMVADGDASSAVDYMLSSAGNSFPYGFYLSSFHLMLVPTVWSGNPYLFAQVLQVLFLPCTLALTVGLVYRFASPKAAVYSSMILLGSWAFFDGALQVRPESLDLLCYPLIVGAVLLGKRWRFVGLVAFTVYGHGVAALSNVHGLAVARLGVASWRKAIAVGVLVVLPVLVVSALYIGGAFSKWGGAGLTENPQEVLFWTDPTFIPYYMGATLLSVPFLFNVIKDKLVPCPFSNPKVKEHSQLVSLALYGLVGNLVMLPLWADRWLHYVSLPLAIIGGVGIAELPQGKLKMFFVFALLDIFIVYVASYFGFSFGFLGRWWQPGD